MRFSVSPASSAPLRYLLLLPSFLTSLLLYLLSATNTSFDTASRSLASRTTPPSRSTNPAIINGSNRDANATPYSRSIRPKSIPSNCRNPKNNSSSSALLAVTFSCCSTGNPPPCTALTYAAASCAFAHRCVPENECAPAPNPKYASRRQYFKLCREANPGFAQLEIS